VPSQRIEPAGASHAGAVTRPHPALLALARTGDLPSVADEREVVASAWEHRMSGLVADAVARRPLHDPAATLLLGERVDRQRSWHGRLWETLDVAVQRLAPLGIEPATIKGVTAEARWYAARGQRPCRDVDLLLGPGDVSRAADAIRALQPGHPFASLDPSWVTSGKLQAATLDIEGVTVDLHFDALKVGVPCRQADLVWSRTAALDLESGATARVLDPELSLVVFLLHLNKDRFRYLLGLIDVRNLLERESVDWDFVATFLADEGLTLPATRSLEVVCDTLSLRRCPLPPVRSAKSLVWSIVWRPSIHLRGEEGRRRFRKRQELIPFLGHGRARDGLTNMRRVLFPPRRLYEIANPDERGSYVRRVLLTRPVRYAKRTRS
jgi:hypothetical protein